MDIKQQNFTYIGKGSTLVGNLRLGGTSHINSRIEGEIHMLDKSANLIVERTGLIEGTIFCHDIEIYGVVTGKISATGKIIVYPPASVSGIIEAINLVVYPGSKTNLEAKISGEPATTL